MKKNQKKTENKANFMLRIFSVFLAIIAWFIIVQVENPDDNYTVRNIPIEAKNSEVLEKDNLIFYGLQEEQVTVKFSGGKVNLGRLREYKDDITATIDLNDYYGSNHYVVDEGTYLPITINVPDSIKNLVKVERQSLEYVAIKIDEKVIYPTEVELNMKVNVGDDYFVEEDKAKVLPQKIEITGAKSVIDTISKVCADVTVSSNNGEINDAAVKVLNKEGKIIEGLKISPEKVQVQVPVLTKKTVNLSLDVKNALDPSLVLDEVKIEPSEIVVAGTKEIISKLTENLSIAVDLESKPGNYIQTKEVVLNDKLVNVNNTAKVNITYTIKKQQ